MAFLPYQQICALGSQRSLGRLWVLGTMEPVRAEQLGGGRTVQSKKIAVVALLCAVVALAACRREEYVPLKLGGPATEQPAR